MGTNKDAIGSFLECLSGLSGDEALARIDCLLDLTVLVVDVAVIESAFTGAEDDDATPDAGEDIDDVGLDEEFARGCRWTTLLTVTLLVEPLGGGRKSTVVLGPFARMVNFLPF